MQDVCHQITLHIICCCKRQAGHRMPSVDKQMENGHIRMTTLPLHAQWQQ